jgi:hypothetical protein
MTGGTICFGLLGLIMYCSADAPTVSRDYCQITKILNPARTDSKRIKRQALESNTKYRRLCGDKRGYGK